MSETEIRPKGDPRPSARVIVQGSTMHAPGEGVFVLVSNGTDSAGTWLDVEEVEQLVDAVADALGRAELRVRRPLVEGQLYRVLPGHTSGEGYAWSGLDAGSIVRLVCAEPDVDGDVEVRHPHTGRGACAWLLPEYLTPATTEETSS